MSTLRALDLDRTSNFNVSEQLARCSPERLRDSQQRDDRDYVLSSLDGTDVAPVHVDRLRQLFLAQSSPFPSLTDCVTKDYKRFRTMEF